MNIVSENNRHYSHLRLNWYIKETPALNKEALGRTGLIHSFLLPYGDLCIRIPQTRGHHQQANYEYAI